MLPLIALGHRTTRTASNLASGQTSQTRPTPTDSAASRSCLGRIGEAPRVLGGVRIAPLCNTGAGLRLGTRTRGLRPTSRKPVPASSVEPPLAAFALPHSCERGRDVHRSHRGSAAAEAARSVRAQRGTAGPERPSSPADAGPAIRSTLRCLRGSAARGRRATLAAIPQACSSAS